MQDTQWTHIVRCSLANTAPSNGSKMYGKYTLTLGREIFDYVNHP
ncbi:MAG: hypothetical protein J07HQW2_02797 [Haloquadratum walsbyi J07HQW2]|uniref:Uncharacterized protein n=1 Tax=Haloquadratum walsbyi J07HQW2 TaxID=1238425 RepID=U1PV95_9EURY|nr:MAG: hypothetical protein J07HQW2_02797 [Haloquadratum walsbyi J07HQW2]